MIKPFGGIGICLLISVLFSCANPVDFEKEESYFKSEKGILYYKGTPFNGEGIIKHENKNTISVSRRYNEGKLELYKSFFEDGSLAEKYSYKNGLRHGNWEIYYSPEKLKGKGKYRDDKLVMNIEEYYENGIIKTKIYRENDPSDILLEEFYPTGKLKHKVYQYYHDNDRYNPRIQADETYNSNGNVIDSEICFVGEGCPYGIPEIFREVL
jgi:antitoxin component YwqK of YwqJK toxin-antitoxin module